MPATTSILSKVTLGISVAVGLYSAILGLLLTPSLQRFALYAHKFNTIFYNNLNDPREFGFAKNQVTPFNILTPDGETLYVWHVLPIDAYASREKQLQDEEPPHGPIKDFTNTTAFNLLRSAGSPPARVIVNFHGNAGHVGQGWRTDTYRYITSLPNTHVITVDYRGFGYSTGSPTEAGLIIDGTAVINWVLHVAEIPPEQIVILGQSLGTAVASAVGLRFADPMNELIPRNAQETHVVVGSSAEPAPITFAGIVLVAPFSSIPSLLLTYRIGGIFPILLPLRPFPALANWLTSHMADKWLSAERLAAYYAALAGSPRLKGPDGRKMGALQLVHALNDQDISYHQTEMICEKIRVDNEKCIDGSDGPTVMKVDRKDRPYLRFELLQYGGHNRIATCSPVLMAVRRALNDSFDH